jgi:hypothetical protein
MVDELEHGGGVELLRSIVWNASVLVELPAGNSSLSGRKFTIVHDKKKVGT